MNDDTHVLLCFRGALNDDQHNTYDSESEHYLGILFLTGVDCPRRSTRTGRAAEERHVM